MRAARYLIGALLAAALLAGPGDAHAEDEDEGDLWAMPLLRPMVGAEGSAFVLDVAAGASVILSRPWRPGVYLVPTVGYTLTRGERDGHAFTTALGEGFPPACACGFGLGIGDVDRQMGCREEERVALARESRQRLHVPDVRLVDVHAAFAGEQMERCNPKVVDGRDRPTVPAIRRDVAIGELGS